MIRAYFGATLGLLWVVVVVCVATVSECDRMSLNNLYWDVDAPITHPNIELLRYTEGAGYSPTPSAYVVNIRPSSYSPQSSK